VFARLFRNLLERHRFPYFHGQTHFRHLIGQHFRESPVFRVVHCHFVPDAVRDHLPQFQDQFSLFTHLSPSFQSLTCSLIQSYHSSIPSPVFAETGMIFISGFSRSTRSLHASKSKSKQESASILLISRQWDTWNMSGYFSGLSSPSGTLKIM